MFKRHINLILVIGIAMITDARYGRISTVNWNPQFQEESTGYLWHFQNKRPTGLMLLMYDMKSNLVCQMCFVVEPNKDASKSKDFVPHMNHNQTCIAIENGCMGVPTRGSLQLMSDVDFSRLFTVAMLKSEDNHQLDFKDIRPIG